jgi:hypothetical protein
MCIERLIALASWDVKVNGIDSRLPDILKSLHSLQSSLLKAARRKVSQATLARDYVEVLYNVEMLEVICAYELQVLRETYKGVPVYAYEYNFQYMSTLYRLTLRLQLGADAPNLRWEMAEDLIRTKSALWRMYDFIDAVQLKQKGKIKYENIMHGSRERAHTYA